MPYRYYGNHIVFNRAVKTDINVAQDPKNITYGMFTQEYKKSANASSEYQNFYFCILSPWISLCCNKYLCVVLALDN
jgi:hypothetical protein